MITDADIKRINELYHKSKSEGLTPDEKQEQVKLREAYIESVRANMRRQLNNIDVKRPDGSIAVSYTHLDVYKRQMMHQAMRFP